jgi:hypothetical protein
MTVVVEPATFTMVDFDAARITELVAEVAGWAGLADEVRVVVVEEVPLTEVSLESIDPVVLRVEGGAFEDSRRLRKLSDSAVQTVAARFLYRAADRRRPGFGEPPPESALTAAQSDVWDVWALGRASRHGLEVQLSRWRYRFRNRHGFTDASDVVFDRLWASGDLVWADLEAACAETAAARF